MIDDGRPPGWTETLALVFVVEYAHRGSAYRDTALLIAEWFVEGDWAGIQRVYPEFDQFVQERTK